MASNLYTISRSDTGDVFGPAPADEALSKAHEWGVIVSLRSVNSLKNMIDKAGGAWSGRVLKGQNHWVTFTIALS